MANKNRRTERTSSSLEYVCNVDVILTCAAILGFCLAKEVPFTDVSELGAYRWYNFPAFMDKVGSNDFENKILTT